MLTRSPRYSKQYPTLLGLLAALCLCLVLPAHAVAQDDPIPRIGDAEDLFRQAVELFEQGEYEEAHETFDRVYNTFPLNRITTAALIMDAKSLYRMGAYEDAQSRAENFLFRYPTSGYVREAQHLVELSERVLERELEEVQPVRLGIAMRVEGEEGAFSQDLFHGIRLAVEEDNDAIDVDRLAAEMYDESNGEPGPIAFMSSADERHRPVQMVFEDIGTNTEDIRRAVEELVAQDVDMIIGPVFSDEAIEAGAVAEQHGVPFFAPLATDDRVSEGRTYVFQANPTLSIRGRQMARFAVEELGLETIGIAASMENPLSERMAESFHEEALRLGAEVPFYQLVANEEEWQGWTDLVELDSLMVALEDEGRPLNAVYLPFTGSDAPRMIRMALHDLDRVQPDLQVLGNAEWHNLSNPTPLARHRTVYTNDFHLDGQAPQVRTFEHRHRLLTGNEPERLAYVGYDLTRFLLLLINQYEGESLFEVIRQEEPFEGLSMRFDFRGGNANQALFFHRYRYGHIELLR